LYNILNVIRFIAKWGFILGLIVWLAIEAVGYVQHFRELIKK
jgi:predicted ABC-type exoprotein transport system permease subunit